MTAHLDNHHQVYIWMQTRNTAHSARRYNGGVLAFQVPASVKTGALYPSQLPFKRLFPDPVDQNDPAAAVFVPRPCDWTRRSPSDVCCRRWARVHTRQGFGSGPNATVHKSRCVALLLDKRGAVDGCRQLLALVAQLCTLLILVARVH